MENKKSKDKLFLYIPIAVLLLAGLSLLPLIDVSAYDLFYYLAAFLAIIFGAAHVFVMNRFLFPSVPVDIKPGLWLSLLIVFISLVLISAIYRYSELNKLFSTYTVAFLIPYLCWQSYRQFLTVAER